VSHEETEILLSAYLDGETSPEETAAVERHLEDCEECRQELESLRATVDALAELPPELAPPGFLDDVQATIRRRSAGRFFTEEAERSAPLRYDVVAVTMLLVLASVATALLPSAPAPVPRISSGADEDAGARERAAFRVLAAGLDPGVVRRLATESGATAVREPAERRLEIDLPAGAGQRLVDRLNEASPLEVERFAPPPAGPGDRVVVRY